MMGLAALTVVGTAQRARCGAESCREALEMESGIQQAKDKAGTKTGVGKNK